MKVIQLITRNPVMIKHSETIKEAAKVMKKEKISSVLIHDDNNIVGIVTERDITRAIADNIDLNLPVSKIMSSNLICIESEKEDIDALVLMLKNNIRHLVVKNKGNIIGVVSIRDVSDSVLLSLAEVMSY
ncbi:MAG: CBS domain-containing protein [Saccharolobus sp.]|uniref:CBS domain-containing protein n=1 Tax=Saccharolobus sp. TaxID=2100761 RepID=UPI003168873B